MSKLQPFNTELLYELIQIVEEGKRQAALQANSTLNAVFWQVGNHINKHILSDDRAEYGKQIINALAQKLTEKFGRNFEVKNLRRMIQFAKLFPDFETVVTFSSRLTWSHFVTIIPVKDETA